VKIWEDAGRNKAVRRPEQARNQEAEFRDVVNGVIVLKGGGDGGSFRDLVSIWKLRTLTEVYMILF
jgi:hypothetical protein